MNVLFTIKPSGFEVTDPSNNLNNAERELLTVLMEECSEALAIIGKILRHGLDNTNPDKPEDGTNRDMLVRELGDVKLLVSMLSLLKVIDEGTVEVSARKKISKISKYLHHTEIKPYNP